MWICSCICIVNVFLFLSLPKTKCMRILPISSYIFFVCFSRIYAYICVRDHVKELISMCAQANILFVYLIKRYLTYPHKYKHALIYVCIHTKLNHFLLKMHTFVCVYVGVSVEERNRKRKNSGCVRMSLLSYECVRVLHYSSHQLGR